MRMLILLPMLSIILVGCDTREAPKANLDSNKTATNAVNDQRDIERYPVDNTGRNVRDRDTAVKTPFDQSESKSDRTLVQTIRQELMDNDSLSSNAKNIKVIIIDGVVTLRGPVKDDREKMVIVERINRISGIKRIDNQLEVEKK